MGSLYWAFLMFAGGFHCSTRFSLFGVATVVTTLLIGENMGGHDSPVFPLAQLSSAFFKASINRKAKDNSCWVDNGLSRVLVQEPFDGGSACTNHGYFTLK